MSVMVGVGTKEAVISVDDYNFVDLIGEKQFLSVEIDLFVFLQECLYSLGDELAF